MSANSISNVCRMGSKVVRAVALGALCAAVLLAVVGAGGPRVSAAEKDLQVNALASATQCWLDEMGSEVCEQITLEVLTPGKGFASGACLTIVTSVDGMGAATEEGCAEVAGLFWMDQDHLSAAGLPQVMISLSSWVCDGKGGTCDIVPTRTVALSADWVASAAKQRVNETLYDHQPSCDVLAKVKGFARDASTTIVLDGTTLTGSGNLQWLESTSRCA